MYVDISIYLYMYVYIHIRIHIYTYIHICIYTYIHAYIYICVYIHIYMYTHTHTHIYMYIYSHLEGRARRVWHGGSITKVEHRANGLDGREGAREHGGGAQPRRASVTQGLQIPRGGIVKGWGGKPVCIIPGDICIYVGMYICIYVCVRTAQTRRASVA